MFTHSSPRQPCYHVDASNGMTYGVAAHTGREAKSFLQERLASESDLDARPVRAVRVATWDAAYGTVLCYGPSLPE